MLLFSVVLFVTLYHNLAFVHRNAISISNPTPNPPTPSSVFVKELSVNDNNMSKNNNANIRTAHPLPQATIKTHALALKTTSQKRLASKSNISNQRVSLPIGNNHNINNYTLTKSPTQNTNNFSLSQQSSIGKSLSNGNSRTREKLANLPISNNNNNNTSNIQINSHLAVVPHHVVIPTKTTAATSKNNTGIVHKTIASTQIPNFNDDSTKIYYESSTVSTKSQLQQQQQEQELKSITQPNLDSLSLITANAGPDQKIEEGKKVTLHGAGSDSSSSSSTDQLNFLWNQISGKSVKLHHTDTAKAKFKAPHVTKTTKLGFQLIVYDSSGNSSSDTVNIIVKSHKLSHSHKHRQ